MRESCAFRVASSYIRFQLTESRRRTSLREIVSVRPVADCIRQTSVRSCDRRERQDFNVWRF